METVNWGITLTGVGIVLGLIVHALTFAKYMGKLDTRVSTLETSLNSEIIEREKQRVEDKREREEDRKLIVQLIKEVSEIKGSFGTFTSMNKN